MKKPSYFVIPGPKASGVLTVASKAVIVQVCKYYKIQLEQIQAPTRKREIVFIRHLLIYLLRKKARLAEKEVANIVNRDRSDVNRAVISIENYIATNSLNKRDEIIMHIEAAGIVA